MKKLLIPLIILIMLLSVAAVSAEDNQTQTADDELAVESEVNVISENESATVPSENTNQTVEVIKNTTQIQASKTTGYESFNTKITFNLTANNTPLTGKTVKILLNNVTYNKKTGANGQGTLNVKLPVGTYTAKITFEGDENNTKATKSIKITIKSPLKTTLKQGDKDINYRQGLKSLFYVKLVDVNGKSVKNQNVTIKVNGKTYKIKTNSNGNAKIYLNLKKGSYTVKYSFTKTSPYLSSSGSCKIKVKAAMAKGNGYWVWSSHMKKVNLKSLAGKGTKQIFLHVHAISVHGKTAVTKWIAKANKYGIKVHLWMQVFYSGGKWVRPCNPDGSLKYSYMNSKIKEAKQYSKIKGVYGIHFDYVRFGGTAHLYGDKSVDAINYFVKKACKEVRKVNSNIVVSAAIMPEPSMMEYYYGQDIPTMSKYVDVLLPMVYKGNYGKNTAWIKSVTSTFVKQSNGAKVWTGLQSYKSDSNTAKLTQSELLKDAKAAMNGGAGGVILFRYGISCNFNFKKL